MAENSTTLELADVIKALRQELVNAQQLGQNEKIRFNVNNVEVELETVVEKEVGTQGGGKIKLLGSKRRCRSEWQIQKCYQAQN